MPFGLLQFAPRAVHCLCQGWPPLWTQLMANLESMADFVVVLSVILVITGEPACGPPPQPVRLTGQAAGGARELVQPVDLIRAIEGMDEDDEVVRDRTDHRHGQRDRQSGHPGLGPEGVDDFAADAEDTSGRRAR